MLNFFRIAAKGFLIFFFWIFIIAAFVIGTIVAMNVNILIGLGIIFGGGIIIILSFSLCGTFLAMAEDITAIRKKFVSDEELAQQKLAEQELYEQGQYETPNDGIWHCNVCNCDNDGSNSFCIFCGAPKP